MSSSHRRETLELGRYQVDPERGFLPPADPLTKLPEKLSFLDELGRQLPELLRTKRLRPTADALDVADVEDLEERETQRAFMIYTFLANAYVRSLAEEPASRLPRGVAVPLYRLARKLDRLPEIAPALSYETYVLYNWRRKVPADPITVDNLETLITFADLPDESWFILIHTEIEAEAAPALAALPRLREAVAARDAAGLEQSLATIAGATHRMVETLRRMNERNSPERFYRDFRPYLMFFTNVVYEGVDEFGGRPQSPIGETGAQSSILPALDAALGIKHRQTGMTDHISEMRRYMPKGHRELIEALERGPALRRHLQTIANRPAREPYDTCLENIAAFRDQHYHWADQYIHKKVTDPRGTGGTPFMLWLGQLRDETLEARLASTRSGLAA